LSELRQIFTKFDNFNGNALIQIRQDGNWVHLA